MEGWRYKRGKWLVRHGFCDEDLKPDYSAYVRSPHWRQFRKSYFASNSAACWVCTKTEDRLVLHHLTYNRIGEERFDDVLPMCARCHRLVHDKRATGLYVFKGAHRELRKVYRARGESQLDYLERKLHPKRVVKKPIARRSGALTIKHGETLTPEDRARYGL
jgi:hypothetical protein